MHNAKCNPRRRKTTATDDATTGIELQSSRIPLDKQQQQKRGLFVCLSIDSLGSDRSRAKLIHFVCV